MRPGIAVFGYLFEPGRQDVKVIISNSAYQGYGTAGMLCVDVSAIAMLS
jgi:hypothetical protein